MTADISPFCWQEGSSIEAWSLVAIVAMIGCLIYPLVRKALASLTIAIGIFIIFAIELASNFFVVDDLAFSPIYLQYGYAPYTIFTTTFLHANFFHIFSNALILAMIGLIFEERIGTPRFLAVFIVSGIAGNLVYGLMNFGDNGVVVGASGAISGILGMILVLYPRERTGLMMLPIPIPNLPVWALVLIMMAWQFVFILDPYSYVAWEGHVGGFIAGAAMTPLVMRIGSREGGPRGEAIDIMLFANNPKEREIVERIRMESVPDVRDAWLEELAKTARCPKCNAGLAAFRGGLRCKSGHRYRIGR
jgi:membrane associated rhomboid family serine protease